MVAGLAERRRVMAGDPKELLGRLLGTAFGEGDLSIADELISPEYVHHDASVPIRGPEGFKQLVGMFKGAFPDLRVDVRDVFSDGDRVGSRGVITGTQRGEFMGVPPTDRPVSFAYQDLWRVESGRFVETWVRMDTMAMMQQLGALPGAA
jgi:predicted ester cyclase